VSIDDRRDDYRHEHGDNSNHKSEHWLLRPRLPVCSSVHSDEFETALGGDLHRGLDVIDCRQGYSVRSIEHDKPFASTCTGAQIGDPVRA
jgi:hypothetical protein